MIDEHIRQLDDASALRMLRVITEAHQGQAKEIPPSRELAKAMNEALGGPCEATHDPNDGDVIGQEVIIPHRAVGNKGRMPMKLTGKMPVLLFTSAIQKDAFTLRSRRNLPATRC